MSDTTMTLTEQRLLEKCREIELLCKDLYLHFSKLYADDAEAACLWQKTADEEQNHAEQFTLAIKLRSGLSCQVTVDSNQVDSIISQMKAVIDKVRLNPPALQEALGHAIRLEKYLAEFHLGCVVTFRDKNCKNMFNAMMASDNEHIESLQSAYDRLAAVQD